jgi:hypothetical protein
MAVLLVNDGEPDRAENRDPFICGSNSEIGQGLEALKRKPGQKGPGDSLRLRRNIFRKG